MPFAPYDRAMLDAHSLSAVADVLVYFPLEIWRWHMTVLCHSPAMNSSFPALTCCLSCYVNVDTSYCAGHKLGFSANLIQAIAAKCKKGQILTLEEAETPEPILTKLGMISYVQDPTHMTTLVEVVLLGWSGHIHDLPHVFCFVYRVVSCGGRTSVWMWQHNRAQLIPSVVHCVSCAKTCLYVSVCLSVSLSVSMYSCCFTSLVVVAEQQKPCCLLGQIWSNFIESQLCDSHGHREWVVSHGELCTVTCISK